MILGIFATIAALTTGFLINDALGCSDIVDFYAHQDSLKAYDKSCPYTVTYIPKSMFEHRIPRSAYDSWAEEYEKLGMLPPYEKRFDTNRVFPPDYHRRKFQGRRD